MPDYLIEGEKQATVPVWFMVSAKDEVEACRIVYGGAIEPEIIGQPSFSWDVRVKKWRELTDD